MLGMRHRLALAGVASAGRDEAVLPGRADRAGPGAGRGIRLVWVEAALAAAAFAALCVVVLSVAPQLVEPDDSAYQASIVAMTEGNFLTLSSAQANALAVKLEGPAGAGPGVYVPSQWVELSDGRYISEKDPGYPFLAAPFQALGIIRWAPLFYGAVACLGLSGGRPGGAGSWSPTAAPGSRCSAAARTTTGRAWPATERQAAGQPKANGLTRVTR
jgi:hypothetical protein